MPEQLEEAEAAVWVVQRGGSLHVRSPGWLSGSMRVPLA